MDGAVRWTGAVFGSLVVLTTALISPGVAVAGLMSTDSGRTDLMVPILVAVPFGLALGVWAIAASAETETT